MCDNVKFRLFILFSTIVSLVLIIWSLFSKDWARFKTDFSLSTNTDNPGVPAHFSSTSVYGQSLWQLEICTMVMGVTTCLAFSVDGSQLNATYQDPGNDDLTSLWFNSFKWLDYTSSTLPGQTV